MPTLEDALLLAVTAHWGQKEWSGVPYVLHPLRMMLHMHTEDEMMVAILHDVVEDTGTTLDDLRGAGYPDQVLAAVDCLTRRPEEPYEDFIERIAPNPLACRVKIADLEDNMNVLRIPGPEAIDDRALHLLRRYRKAWSRLTGR